MATKVKRAILRVYGYDPMDSADFTFQGYGLAPNLPTAPKITDGHGSG